MLPTIVMCLSLPTLFFGLMFLLIGFLSLVMTYQPRAQETGRWMFVVGGVLAAAGAMALLWSLLAV